MSDLVASYWSIWSKGQCLIIFVHHETEIPFFEAVRFHNIERFGGHRTQHGLEREIWHYPQCSEEFYDVIRGRDWPEDVAWGLDERAPFVLLIGTLPSELDPNVDDWKIVWFSELWVDPIAPSRMFDLIAWKIRAGDDPLEYVGEYAEIQYEKEAVSEEEGAMRHEPRNTVYAHNVDPTIDHFEASKFLAQAIEVEATKTIDSPPIGIHGPEFAAAIGKPGRNEKYDWPTILAKADELYPTLEPRKSDNRCAQMVIDWMEKEDYPSEKIPGQHYLRIEIGKHRKSGSQSQDS